MNMRVGAQSLALALAFTAMQTLSFSALATSELCKGSKFPEICEKAIASVDPKVKEAAGPAAVDGDTLPTTLGYDTVVDLSDSKGMTFFAMMQKEIKPKLDNYAKFGFKIANGKIVEEALKKVEGKVYRKAIRAAGDVANLKLVADALSKSTSAITFYDLPAAIMEQGVPGSAYDLATFFALVSGGGVAVRIEDGSYAYNVNYGTGEIDKDEMTGRSFGEAPGRLALDASDAHYLEILQDYVRGAGESSRAFYLSMMQILMNNDTSTYSQISDEGKAVAADFIAVYIAEQDRHLMANLQTHHWDQALLEVTLLSALHAGQSQVAVMYNDELTSTTRKQQSGCTTTAAPTQPASMVDYWQFSSNTEKPNCTRSGINITKRDFRKLGRAITQFEKKKNPKLVAAIEHNLGHVQISGNVFADLSTYLINFKTPRNFNAKELKLAEDFTNFLMQVREDADEISAAIVQAQ